MKYAIVTTTIQPPTEALLKYAAKDGWQLIVVGDRKTPHEAYLPLTQGAKPIVYLSPEDQERRYPELSAAVPWDCIERRNLGFVEAYRRGAEVIATVDDDNIPYECWGENLLVGQEVEIDLYSTPDAVFDPLVVTEHRQLWHRGFPLELLPRRHLTRYEGKVRRRILIQADLWDGDPDIDAIARITFSPSVTFNTVRSPFGSDALAPFNSQNTFIAREVFPHYCVLPFVGRISDIWAAYLAQREFPKSLAFAAPSVFQRRNPHDLISDMEAELLGYRRTMEFVSTIARAETLLAPNVQHFLAVYARAFAP